MSTFVLTCNIWSAQGTLFIFVESVQIIMPFWWHQHRLSCNSPEIPGMGAWHFTNTFCFLQFILQYWYLQGPWAKCRDSVLWLEGQNICPFVCWQRWAISLSATVWRGINWHTYVLITKIDLMLLTSVICSIITKKSSFLNLKLTVVVLLNTAVRVVSWKRCDYIIQTVWQFYW